MRCVRPGRRVHIETPRRASYSDEENRRRLAAALNLASQLGAHVAFGARRQSAMDGLKSFVVEARATQLVVGKSARSRWFEMRHGSVVDRLVRENAGHGRPCPAVRRRGPAEARPAARGAGSWGDRSAMSGPAALVAARDGHWEGGSSTRQHHQYRASLSGAGDDGGDALRRCAPACSPASCPALAYNFFFIPPTCYADRPGSPEHHHRAGADRRGDRHQPACRAGAACRPTLRHRSARPNSARWQASRARSPRPGTRTEVGADVVRRGGPAARRARPCCCSPAGTALRWSPPHAAGGPAGDDRAGRRRTGPSTTASPPGAAPTRSRPRIGCSSPLFGRRAACSGVFGLARADGGRSGPPLTDFPLLMSLARPGGARAGADAAGSGNGDRRARCKERDRLRAALLSSVSHDLRTPLTTDARRRR